MTRESTATAISKARRQATSQLRAALREGVPLAEVLARPEAAGARLPVLLGSIPHWGEARVEEALRGAEGELGPYTNRLWLRRVGELTRSEIEAVLERV